MDVRYDLPVPLIQRYSESGIAPTIRNMKINGSFDLSVEKRKSLYFALWAERKKPENRKKRFVTRTIKEGETKVIRCWRVE